MPLEPKNAEFLGSLFGDYRAEWSPDLFASYFVRPAYFDRLIAKRPSLLIGGRGTGKTTALKSLRFDAFHPHTDAPWEKDYLGLYIRINKNRVRAFSGEELSGQVWSHAFAHYFNLLACQELCALTEWMQTRTASGVELAPSLALVAQSFLFSEKPQTASELRYLIDAGIIALELFVNNPTSAPRPTFSMAEAPLKIFCGTLRDAGLLGDKIVFCCIDEYENLTFEQQAIVNTYIKHSEPPLTFKIGIRRNGLRTRSTIDRNDQIATPDDYAEIDIATEQFDDFAVQVAELRLKRARDAGVDVPATLAGFLPELSYLQEADLLGGGAVAEATREKLVGSADADLATWGTAATLEDLLLIAYWADGHGDDVAALARDCQRNGEAWKTRFGNYGHSCLFWLSRGRKGARRHKYYCGAETFLSLSSGNIRYFLELIDESIRVFLLEPQGSGGAVAIPGAQQTTAAHIVGKRRLGQLEGLSEHGVDLKRFVLAIGKVFFEFARDPRKAPETNAFVLSGAPDARAEVGAILADGVSHLAFEATPRTKATAVTEMRDEEYRIHPIYAAFFEYSYRRKRRAIFSAEDLLLLRTSPKRALHNLLGDTESHAAVELPSQLAMFAQFFEGDDDD